MAEDDTQNTLYIDCYETAARAEQTEHWRDTETKFREQVSRFELEMSRLQLEMEKEKTAKEIQDLKSQWNQLQDERARLLDGGLTSLASGSSKFRSDINNILENIHTTAEAAHKADIEVKPLNDLTIGGSKNLNISNGQNPIASSLSMGNVAIVGPHSPRIKTALSTGKLKERNEDLEAFFPHSKSLPLKAHRASIRRSANHLSPREISPRPDPPPNSTPTQTSQPSTRAVIQSQPVTGPHGNRQARRPVSGSGLVICTICKVSYDKDHMSLLRGKPFCPRCKERLLEGAKQRGMKI